MAATVRPFFAAGAWRPPWAASAPASGTDGAAFGTPAVQPPRAAESPSSAMPVSPSPPATQAARAPATQTGPLAPSAPAGAAPAPLAAAVAGAPPPPPPPARAPEPALAPRAAPAEAAGQTGFSARSAPGAAPFATSASAGGPAMGAAAQAGFAAPFAGAAAAGASLPRAAELASAAAASAVAPSSVIAAVGVAGAVTPSVVPHARAAVNRVAWEPATFGAAAKTAEQVPCTASAVATPARAAPEPFARALTSTSGVMAAAAAAATAFAAAAAAANPTPGAPPAPARPSAGSAAGGQTAGISAQDTQVVDLLSDDEEEAQGGPTASATSAGIPRQDAAGPRGQKRSFDEVLHFGSAAETLVRSNSSQAPILVRSSGSQDEAAAPPLPPLSEQQSHVVDMVLRDGSSIFFTGLAGTGKSRTLKEIIALADPSTTHVTALTGIAASALPQGKTLHSFAGIGLGKGPWDEILANLKRSGKVKGWKQCKLLIVDEVSMMSKALFELLEYVARMVREDPRPFGGVQLVFCGDFFQLPPVAKNDRNRDAGRFCFESPKWTQCLQGCVELTKVYRQQDELLLRLLAEVRYNKASQASVDLLRRLRRALPPKNAIEATRLFCKNVAVDQFNLERLNALPTKVATFAAEDTGPRNALEQLERLSKLPQCLELKEGAQVMHLVNANGLINGSRGVVIGFSGLENEPQWPIVRWLNGRETTVMPEAERFETGPYVLKRRQLPLRLAWAITIHKAQGMSIDYLDVDLQGVFERGQAYVALSRARSLEGLCVRDFDPRCFWCDGRVVEFYERFVRPVEALKAAGGQLLTSCPK